MKESRAGNLDSPRSADGLRDAIEYHARTLSHIGEELPARWLKVRADIEARAREVAHISRKEYFDIYARHMEFDRDRALQLSQYFHDLGVFLHFQDDPLLSRTVILQNTWATEAVFRILDDERVKARLGRFDNTDCERLWRDSSYADMHPELLALMQKFDLCYELADTKPATWLAPQLLPATKPVALADWARPDDFILRYKYEFMPKGLVSRLTVRLHRFVLNPEMACVTGVLFTQEATSALVEVMPSGRIIEIRARGPECRGLLSVVASHLDALNDSFKGLQQKVDKLIPCTCEECAKSDSPDFHEQKYLLKRVADRKSKFECRNYDSVDAQELLDGARIGRLPAWAEPPRAHASLRQIRVFVTSSEELRADRDEIDHYLRQRNDHFVKRGIYFEVVHCQHFLGAMSAQGLQHEYNEAIRGCEIFLSLFFTKTGKFTEEEFDAAHAQFKRVGRPSIYTFFKNAEIRADDARSEDLESLRAFQEKLAGLGHYCSRYNNIEHLKRQFRDQIDQLLDL